MKKILVVKIGAIGDVVMALPLLSHFREQAEPVHITWICSTTVEPLLQATQKVDRIIAFDEQALFKASFLRRLKELIRIQWKIAFSQLDLILIGHVDWRYRLFSLFARGKETRKFARTKERQIPVPGRYHAYEYLRLATQIDDANPPKPKFPQLTLPHSDSVDHLLREYAGTFTIAIAPGGAKNVLANDHLRRWPIQNYVSLAKKLDVTVLLLGGYSDQWVLPFFQGVKFVNLIGKLAILDLLCVLQRSSLLITHDSGPLHLAKLVECPVIGLFGPTNPHEKVGSDEKVTVLWGGETLSCRPCYDGKTYARCTQNVCLQRISVDQVLSKIQELRVSVGS